MNELWLNCSIKCHQSMVSTNEVSSLISKKRILYEINVLICKIGFETWELLTVQGKLSWFKDEKFVIEMNIIARPLADTVGWMKREIVAKIINPQPQVLHDFIIKAELKSKWISFYSISNRKLLQMLVKNFSFPQHQSRFSRYLHRWIIACSFIWK